VVGATDVTTGDGDRSGVDLLGCVDRRDQRGATAALPGYDRLRGDQVADLVGAVFDLVAGV
jgi:hypothetical protein